MIRYIVYREHFLRKGPIMDLSHSKRISSAGLLITLGIIFGDIGTSPLYTFQTIMTEGGRVTEELVLGAISCVFWTLTLQTTFKYVFITLQADNKGEGGVFSLYALVRRYGKTTGVPGDYRRGYLAGGRDHHAADHGHLGDRRVGCRHGTGEGDRTWE